MRKDAWTAEETKLARELFSRRAPASDYQKIVGRSKSAAHEHLRWIDNPEYRLARQRARSNRTVNPRRYRGVESAIVPDRLRQEANERAMAPQTLTGFVFGDPPIGYRAIDRKREQESA